MNRAFASLALLAILATTPNGSWCGVPFSSTVVETSKAILAIQNQEGDVFCTAVAVGPYLVQTQAHCVAAAEERGFTMVWRDAAGATSYCAFDKVVEDDGRDNVLIHTCREWEHYVARAGSLGQFEHVFQFGHPTGMDTMAYREGTVAVRYYNMEENSGDLPKDMAVLFDLNGAGGDSGGGIFNEKGELVCTTSFSLRDPMQAFHFMGCYLSNFKR